MSVCSQVFTQCEQATLSALCPEQGFPMPTLWLLTPRCLERPPGCGFGQSILTQASGHFWLQTDQADQFANLQCLLSQRSPVVPDGNPRAWQSHLIIGH